MTKRIKIVCSSTKKGPLPNTRAHTFFLLCQKLAKSEYTTYPDFTINEDVDEADYIFVFDQVLLKKKNYNYFIETVAKTNLDNTILDVSKDVFDHETLGPVLTLCVVCAGFVTCVDAKLQERIYECTGRLAHIVNTPVNEDIFKKPEDDKIKRVLNPNILWFGSSNDIFSVRKEQVKFNRIETLIVDDWERVDNKKVLTALNFADIIYLPKSFSSSSEEERAKKAIFATTQGKFVIAPDLVQPFDKLSAADTFRQALEVYRKSNITLLISLAQNFLKENYSFDKSVQQFKKALEIAPTDTFQDDLNGLLESGEIRI
jgi:hypothetical protein